MENLATQIAGRYLARWSRGAGSGGRRHRGAAEPRLLMVDVSGGVGSGVAQDPSSSHPLLVLLDPLADAGIPPTLLVLREDPGELGAAEAALEAAGRGEPPHRLREVEELAAAAPGAIYLLEATLETALPGLLPLLDATTAAFAHVSPATPAAVGFPTLRALVEHPSLDLLLHLPLRALRRLAPYRTTPVADLPLTLRRLAEAYSSLLGDPRYEWLALWRAVEAEAGADAAEQRIAERFRERLAGVAPDALVRGSSVRPMEGTPAGTLHFLLATRHPERALGMNAILFELRSQGRLQWAEPADEFVRFDSPGLLDLFADPGGSPAAGPVGAALEPRTRVVDSPALAHHLASQFAAQSVALQDVMRHLAGGDLFPEDVRRALKLLRRDRRAAFRSLAAPDAPVRFAPAGRRF